MKHVQFRRIKFSADADNCLDCALYKKTKDVYKLKDHLVNLRAFASMLGTLNVRDNYAIKQSAFNKLMQTNKTLASTVEKAKANGFRLCPVVPDDFAGMNLDSYADIVHLFFLCLSITCPFLSKSPASIRQASKL